MAKQKIDGSETTPKEASSASRSTRRNIHPFLPPLPPPQTLNSATGSGDGRTRRRRREPARDQTGSDSSAGEQPSEAKTSGPDRRRAKGRGQTSNNRVPGEIQPEPEKRAVEPEPTPPVADEESAIQTAVVKRRRRRHHRRKPEETPVSAEPVTESPAREEPVVEEKASVSEKAEAPPRRRSRGRRGRQQRESDLPAAEVASPESLTRQEIQPDIGEERAAVLQTGGETLAGAKPKRRRTHRVTGPAKAAAASTDETRGPVEAVQTPEMVEGEPAIIEPPPATSDAEEAAREAKPRRRRQTRRRESDQVGAEPARQADGTLPIVELRAPRTARPSRPVQPRARIPITGAPTEEVPAPFAHPAEYEFARILDFYGINWHYEPQSFPLRWERGHIAEAFTPDFYLPDLDLYVELTTLKTGLTTEKNRKMRLLKEQYPDVNIMLLKKRDYLRLLAKYGFGPLSPDKVPEIDRVLLSTNRIQQRVAEIGAQISRDYANTEPVLVGVLRGVICFLADLIRHISVPVSVDFMSISSFEGDGSGAVRILKDLDENIKGRDVILVEDIVDTGMTLNHVIEYLRTKRPASIRVCTLLDKRVRRIVAANLDYTGFEIPDEFVVGYGLDFHQQYRSLPFIAILKHDQLP